MRIRGATWPFLRFRHVKLLAPFCMALLVIGSCTLAVQRLSYTAYATQTPSFSSTNLLSEVNLRAPAAPSNQPVTLTHTSSQDSTPSASRTAPSNCTTAAFRAPVSPTAISTTGPTIVVDAPSYYTFHGGSSASEATTRARQCARQQAALGGYDASTAYAISWSFATVHTGGSMCTLTNIRVSMRVAQLLPQATTSDMPVSEEAIWHASLEQLYAHENQHTSIDQTIATSLYQDLRSLSDSCSTITSRANQLTTAASTALRNQNDAFDAATHHGAL